nr:hypothetical protein [Bacteroidota bacterium]
MPTKEKTIHLIANAIKNLQSSSIHHWVREPLVDSTYSLLAGRAGKGSEDDNTEDREILNKNVIFLDPILIRLLKMVKEAIG